MFNNIKLSQIMTTDLITVGPNETLDRIATIFMENDFHHIPVVDENKKVLGIISKSDYFVLCDSMSYFRKDEESKRNDRLFRSLLASDVMKKHVAKLNQNEVLAVAAGFFRENLFHSIPIVNDKQELVGIVTTFDMINYAYQEPVGRLPK